MTDCVTFWKPGVHDLIIVDEGNVAVTCQLISEEELLTLMDKNRKTWNW